jgi:putative transposase
VLPYVERNALRAGLVKKAQDWRWCSLAHRLAGPDDRIGSLLTRWPLPLLTQWTTHVNRPQTKAELASLRQAA